MRDHVETRRDVLILVVHHAVIHGSLRRPQTEFITHVAPYATVGKSKPGADGVPHVRERPVGHAVEVLCRRPEPRVLAEDTRLLKPSRVARLVPVPSQREELVRVSPQSLIAASGTLLFSFVGKDGETFRE